MAGSQRTQVGQFEPVVKAAGIAVLTVISATVLLGVLDSVVNGRFGAAFSLSRVQYAAVGNISTAAVIGGVLLVFDRGTDQELVTKVAVVVYGAGFVEEFLTALLRSSFGFGLDTLVDPLYAVVTFLGYAVAVHVFFESDIVR